MSQSIPIGFAFLAGLASFLSPCVFSLVPAYVGYLSGRSAASAGRGVNDRWNTLSHGLAFVLGFSVVFVLLGLATSSLGAVLVGNIAVGGVLYDLRIWLARIGGLIVIVFGVHMTGLIRIPFLEYDLRPQTAPDRRRGYLASGLMGVFFSAGWSPCVGPILGSILTLAFNGGSILQGVQLLTAYSAGLAIPFLLASTQIGLVTMVIRRYGKVMHYIEVAMGVVLVIVGVLLLSGRFERLASLGSFFGTFDELQVGMYLLAGLLVLMVLGLIPAWLARNKGRNFWDWWFFGVSLFPVALAMALQLQPQTPPEPVLVPEATPSGVQPTGREADADPIAGQGV